MMAGVGVCCVCVCGWVEDTLGLGVGALFCLFVDGVCVYVYVYV